MQPLAAERQQDEEKPMPTIWRVSDDLWEKIESILQEHDPSKKTGRPRVDQRAALDAVIFRLRTGCQWNRLPKEFPDDSSVHRTFQWWVERGVLDRVWAGLVEECEELGGVDWEWRAADTAMGKARFGGPTTASCPATAPRTRPCSPAWARGGMGPCLAVERVLAPSLSRRGGWWWCCWTTSGRTRGGG